MIDGVLHPELRDRMILLRGECPGQAWRRPEPYLGSEIAFGISSGYKVRLLTALADRFNLVDCLHDYRYAVTIHGDDVLAHHNWEIAESWLQRYKCVGSPYLMF